MQISPTNTARRAILKVRRTYGFTNATVQRDGIRYKLDLNEYIDSEIYLKGFFEEDTTYALQKLSKPGMTIFDIGANSGAHALRMARLVGPSGKVFAFEPVPWARKKLKANIALNGLNNVTVENNGFSDKPAKNVEIEIAASWPLKASNPPPRGRLHPVHKGKLVKERVDFLTIDEYVQSHEIDRLDIIKCDTDGYELKVFRGGVETLKRFLPVLIVEMDKNTLKEKGDALEDLTSFLEDLGYKFYSSENGFRRLSRADIVSLKAGKTRSANVTATRHGLFTADALPLQ